MSKTSAVIEKVKRKVLKKIRPGTEEKDKVKKTSSNIVNLLKESLRKNAISAEVHVMGSVAKGTYLKNNTDIDVFLLFDKSFDRTSFEKTVMQLCETAFPKVKKIVSYAEHPYVRMLDYSGYAVDIVPAYKLRSVTDMKSSVDRTQFHTEFVRKTLKPWQIDEVLLLKQFLKSHDLYGAESKVQGFSGYITELLIIKYGSFERVLEHFASFPKERLALSNEGDLASPKFDRDAFVFLDPVDPERNAGAAVAEDSLWKISWYAKHFLRKPDEKAFIPWEELYPSRVRFSLLEKKYEILGLTIVAIVLKRFVENEEILFSHIKRFSKSLVSIFGSELKLVSEGVDANNRYCVVAFCFDTDRIGSYGVHLGPPIEMTHSVEDFLMEHKEVYRIDVFEGRLRVFEKREATDLHTFIKKTLSENAYRLPEKLREMIENNEFKVEDGYWLIKSFPKLSSILMFGLRYRDF